MMKNIKQLAFVLIPGLLVTLPTGCAGPVNSTKSTQPHPSESSVQQQPPAQSGRHAVPESVVLAGKVVETMNGGGYTYLCLESNGVKGWAAVPAMKVAAGENIQLQPGMKMTNFTSKSLNRTFDAIIFSAGAVQK